MGNSLQKKIKRSTIVEFEALAKEQEDTLDIEAMTTHRFIPGIYERMIVMPPGAVIVGKIHKYATINWLVSGICEVATENGVEHLVGPFSWISEPGTKRIIYSVTESVWKTVHCTAVGAVGDCRDLELLEDHFIAESYEEYDKHKIALDKPDAAKIEDKKEDDV